MPQTRKLVLKICVSAVTIFYGFVPALADLNETHLFNPLWSAHARFHGAWFLTFAAGIALIGLYLIWRRDVLYTPIFFGIIFAAGFCVATILGPAYGGALVDQYGLVHKIAGIETNMFLFSVLSIVLLALLGLATWVSRTER